MDLLGVDRIAGSHLPGRWDAAPVQHLRCHTPLMARYLGGREADVRLFPPFRFDVRDERLWKGTEELKVRRKPFAILKDLTANPRHLVTQEECSGNLRFPSFAG